MRDARHLSDCMIHPSSSDQHAPLEYRFHPAHGDMIPADRAVQLPDASRLQRARKASVLVLLFPTDPTLLPSEFSAETAEWGWSTVFIRRSLDGGVHGGQIALPGGQLESGESYWDAAVRETHEEIGVSPEHISYVSSLSGLYIPPSDFWVQPFIGRCEYRPKFTLDQLEVQEVLPTTIQKVRNWEPSSISIYRSNGAQQVPAFVDESMSIWGATAMITREFQYWLNEAAQP